MSESNNAQAVAQLPGAPAQASRPVVSGNAGSTALEVLGGAESLFYCSFDPKTPEGEAMLFRVAQAQGEELMARINMPIAIEHVYAVGAEKVDEKTGEVHHFTRIVLIDPDGVCYSCGSAGVKKSILLLCSSRGLPPWKGGIVMVPTLERTKTGHNWLTLQFPKPEAAAKGKGGK